MRLLRNLWQVRLCSMAHFDSLQQHLRVKSKYSSLEWIYVETNSASYRLTLRTRRRGTPGPPWYAGAADGMARASP